MKEIVVPVLLRVFFGTWDVGMFFKEADLRFFVGRRRGEGMERCGKLVNGALLCKLFKIAKISQKSTAIFYNLYNSLCNQLAKI